MAGRDNPGRRDQPDPGLPVVSATEEFDVFYRRELPGVLSLCYALTRDPAHAEEIAQEAFYRAYRDWDEVGRMEYRDRWVRRVALDLCYSRLRRWRAEAGLCCGFDRGASPNRICRPRPRSTGTRSVPTRHARLR